MNKSLVMFSFLTLLAISCASSRKKPIIKENGVIADMVLMYYGGAHRQTEWNEEQCMKNVAYRDKKGDLHWMFDGFLFLEFKDGKGRSFASYYEPMSARKSEWKGLCDKYFPLYLIILNCRLDMGCCFFAEQQSCKLQPQIQRISQPSCRCHIPVGHYAIACHICPC